MEKAIILMMFFAVSHAIVQYNIINVSNCTFIKTKNYIVNGVKLLSPFSPLIQPDEDVPVVIDFNNIHSGVDSLLIGVTYKIKCDGVNDGFLDIDLSPGYKSIKTFKSNKVECMSHSRKIIISDYN